MTLHQTAITNRPTKLGDFGKPPYCIKWGRFRPAAKTGLMMMISKLNYVFFYVPTNFLSVYYAVMCAASKTF